MPTTAGRPYFFLGLGEQILAKPATSAAGALRDSLARSPMASWDAPMSFESRGREFESRRPIAGNGVVTRIRRAGRPTTLTGVTQF